jgi:Protein of unknown function (DUF2946)
MRHKPKKSYISNAMRWRVGLLAALMWLAMMAPGLSRWLAASEGQMWVEVCSTQGMRWVEVNLNGKSANSDDSSAPEEAPQKALLEACAYCTLATDRPWLPPTPVQWIISSAPATTAETFVGWTVPQVLMLAPAARGPPHFL